MRTLIILAIILIALITMVLKSQTTSNITYNSGTSIDIGSGADVCADAIIINGMFSGSGTICSGPLPVELSSFTSIVRKNSVILTWETVNELNNAGFDVERASVTSNGTEPWQRTAFIPGSGSTNEPRQYSYEDSKLRTGTYKYRLKQIDFNGKLEYYDLVNDVYVAPPGSFSVGQNYPNPSNPKAKIDYEIPRESKVTIKLFDLLGREVMIILSEVKQEGYYTAEFDGSSLASGVYFYRVLAEGENQNFSKTLKMVLVK
jgi:hypothetical protein